MASIPPERWQRIDDLFAAALEQPSEVRDTFVRQASDGDHALYQEVTSLLHAAIAAESAFGDRASTFAQPLLRVMPSDSDDGGDRIDEGTTFGTYRIVREIARGGMGAVYLAERADANFRKQVAIKVVKRGVDTDEVLQRFRAERQILASFDHPNIARLIDGGVGPDGRPYLVMDYVAGRPITSYCDEHRLGVEQRLALFETVCEAVQYAHQRLVVHRDVKPSNVLVTERGTVSLLDFGIAKVLDDQPDADTPRTRTGVLVLTPEYAAPEQILGAPVTASTDVYSLGVLLFELLVGVRPLRLRGRSVQELSDAITKAEPLHPSAAVLREHEQPSATGAPPVTPAIIAANRSTTPDRLHRRLRGDLETIVLKSLAKEPERRYQSAEQLLEDLRRHRDGRPVRARPDTARYRAGKFVRRHRFGVVASALFLLLVGASMAMLVVEQARTARERDRAERELARANVVTEFLTDMFSAADPAMARGRELTAREILDAGAARVEEYMADQPETGAMLLHVIGAVYGTLGHSSQAKALASRALQIRLELHGPDHIAVAESQNRLGNVLMDDGEYDEAEPLFRASLATRRRILGERHGDVTQSLVNLGLLLTYRGAYDEAEPFIRQALEADRTLYGDVSAEVATDLNNLAVLLYHKGNYAGAEEALAEALAVRREVYGDPHPRVANTLNNLAAVVQRRGKLGEAEALHRQSVAMTRQLHGDDHPDVASSMSNLASVLNERGKQEEAEPLLRRALNIGLAAHGDHPTVADALGNLGTTLRDLGRLDEAERAFSEALRINRATRADEHPRIGLTLYHLGGVALARGDCRAASSRFAQALALQQRVLPEEHDETARSRSALGHCLGELGRFAEAERELLKGHETLTRTHGPEHRDSREARERLAALYLAWGRPDRAASFGEPLAVQTAASP